MSKLADAVNFVVNEAAVLYDAIQDVVMSAGEDDAIEVEVADLVEWRDRADSIGKELEGSWES